MQQQLMSSMGYGAGDPELLQRAKQGTLYGSSTQPNMQQPANNMPSSLPQGMMPALPNPGGAPAGQPSQPPKPNIDPQAQPNNQQPPTSGTGSSSGSTSGTPYQQFSPQDQTNQLMQYLNSRFQSYGYGQGGQGGAQPFNPAQNPFSDPIMGPGGQAQQFSQDWLNTPSRYDTPLAKNTFDLMNQTLNQQQQSDLTQNNADAASRGLFYSSVPQGTEGDINIRYAQSRQQLANNILQNQAQTNAQDRSAALQGALGYSGQRFGQEQQSLQDMLGASQQQYNNQLSTAQFNQSQDQLQNQLMLSLLGVS